MRILSWRLILALTIGLSLVSLASSWYEIRAERDALRRDLDRRAEILGDNVAGTAELYLARGDRDDLERLVEPLNNGERREHLVGVGIYGRDASVLVMTPGLNASLPALTQLLKNAMQDNRNVSAFLELRFRPVHLLATPLHGADKTVAGGILIVHDSSYIDVETFRIWGRVFARMAIQVLVIVAITLLIIRWSLTGPITRVAVWIRALRTGQDAVRPAATDLDVLSSLAREVGPLAESMQRDGHDHKHLNGHASEDAAPDAEGLGVNVAAVVDYEDSADDRFIGRVQWGGKQVDTLEAQIGEGAYVAIVLHRILRQLSEGGERTIEAGRYNDRRVIASVDSYSHQVFAAFGGLDQLLKANAITGREI